MLSEGKPEDVSNRMLQVVALLMINRAFLVNAIKESLPFILCLVAGLNQN
jgi:hypothetical protein